MCETADDRFSLIKMHFLASAKCVTVRFSRNVKNKCLFSVCHLVRTLITACQWIKQNKCSFKNLSKMRVHCYNQKWREKPAWTNCASGPRKKKQAKERKWAKNLQMARIYDGFWWSENFFVLQFIICRRETYWINSSESNESIRIWK